MQSAPSVLFAIPLLCISLFGQSATPTAQAHTFHVRGTIIDPLEALIPGVKVTFRNEHLTTAATTNNVGVYEADLPFGEYTMTAQGVSGFRVYHRPLFRIMSPTIAILNATLLVGDPCGDMVIVNKSGEPVTDEQWRAATEHCRREELIPIPSHDGLRLELSICYGSRTAVGSTYFYTGEKTGQYQTPVFVAYNLFSLQADKVAYDLKSHTIEATGNVIAMNGLGATQRGNSMAFKIEDGQIAPLR